jgi:hypothetical protein
MAVKDPISSYAANQIARHAAICRKLRKAIDKALPGATSKIWHAIPVWFIGENPVVGYHARVDGVMLLFWNGQEFDEPALEAVGKFYAAQIQYEDASEIDAKALRAWLRKAATNIWDYRAMRKGKRRRA